MDFKQVFKKFKFLSSHVHQPLVLKPPRPNPNQVLINSKNKFVPKGLGPTPKILYACTYHHPPINFKHAHKQETERQQMLRQQT